MTIELKPFEYSSASLDFVNQLRGLSKEQKATKLQERLTQGGAPEAVLAGFHAMVSEIVADRKAENKASLIQIPEQSLDQIMGLMAEHQTFFGYDSGKAFFMALEPVKPPIFHPSCNLLPCVAKNFSGRKKEEPKGPKLPPTFDEATKAQIQAVCTTTFEAYEAVLPAMAQLKESKRINDRFAQRDPNITMEQVKQAKLAFEKARVDYQTHANTIAQGMQLIYSAYQAYPEELSLYKIYGKYLAKLLASREAKYPVEPYVLRRAEGAFDFAPVVITLTQDEEYRGVTLETKREEIKKMLQLPIHRLESRYRKRKLMTQMAQGAPINEIIKELMVLVELDPADIKTHILLARLLADYSKSFQNAQKRVTFREKALGFCHSAFTNIDGYLDLQGINDVKERDRTRVGFVKTISDIRLPLVRGH